ncbi:7 transmembrane sweet-taste receptor of 3 GCPR family protein [Acanthocheilonema viteae]
MLFLLLLLLSTFSSTVMLFLVNGIPTITPSSSLSSSLSTSTQLPLSSSPPNFSNDLKDSTFPVLLTQLEHIEDANCESLLALPNLHRLLEHELKRNNPQLLLLAQLIAQNPHSHLLHLPENASLILDSPLAYNLSTPLFVLQLHCSQIGDDPLQQWIPLLIYPTSALNFYLTVRLRPFDLNACTLPQCSNTKCTWTRHGGIRVYARTCCTNDTSLCRDAVEQDHGILALFNGLCSTICILLISVVVRERRRHNEARGWALMEIFLLGAAMLYAILLLDWFNLATSTCCFAVWLRQIGFSTFYGSIVLKIYRNLQEYRVRKAHHVIVKEEDLIKYLACLLALTLTGLIAWTLGSFADEELWKSSWPQCPIQAWCLAWQGYESLFLIYGMRLCYKARNSSWLERWQFTVAVCLEAIVTLLANFLRYSIRYSAHSDTLMTITFVQLHLTVSINIVIIIAPKFYLVSSSKTKRMQTLAGTGSKAHPSLAKLRDNLLNGTIDFAEVPIVDMNPEDIRAELKRVYTQLRMYKLKNLYQDNPHISRRKGGKKSTSDKIIIKNRRLSIPPSSSPKVKRVDEDERNDLTVESAPHNVFLSTYKLQLEPHQSVRV